MAGQNSNDSTVRAFIAVPISDTLKRNIEKVQSALKPLVSNIRWVNPDNVHLTLIFIGDVSVNALESIVGEMDRVSAFHSTCTLKAQGIGFFGTHKSPRVIWAGLRGNIHAAGLIQQDMLSTLWDLGVHTDNRPFHPHLTLGRVKKTGDMTSLISAIIKQKDRCFGDLVMQRILLMKSVLTSKGPEYSIIHESKTNA